MPKRKLKGRFPDRPTLKPAGHTIGGIDGPIPVTVRHPVRKNGRFPALDVKGEEIDCSAASPHRNYWFRLWQCGDVEIVGDHEIVAAKKPAKPTPKRQPPPPPPVTDQE